MKQFQQKKGRKNKYVMFIDFKQAFDSVDHRKLFKKLLEMDLKIEVVNTIKFLYS